MVPRYDVIMSLHVHGSNVQFLKHLRDYVLIKLVKLFEPREQ